MYFNKLSIINVCLIALSQISNCQITTKTITTNIIPNQYNTNILKPSVTTNIFTKTIPQNATEDLNSGPMENIDFTDSYNKDNGINNFAPNINDNSTDLIGDKKPFLNITTNEYPYSNNTVVIEYDKNTNWTYGYGTHYGPFPSLPHFSEIGYQPNDVGVGCSDGRPGGDPKWNEILAKGVYPPPNIVNHEKTVWPVTYTVAVALAVWNKEDVCWKKIKIRNKNKPEYVIEATIVDFCPIGHCLWKDEYLARNVDIYGEKAWNALGADPNESKLQIEIEWPAGVVPHDAISGFSKTDKIITIIAKSLFFAIVTLYIF